MADRAKPIRDKRRSLKKGGQRLPPANKKAARQKEPTALERKYVVQVQRILNPMYAAVKKILIPALSKIVAAGKKERKLDDSSDLISDAMGGISLVVDETVTIKRIAPVADKHAGQVSLFQEKELTRQAVAVTGVTPLFGNEYLSSVTNNFVGENVSLIQSVSPKYLKDVETVVRQGVESGKSAVDIAKEISERTGVSRSSAKVIARDQTTKLYGKLNEFRQQDIGIDGYTWSTSRDRRVRHSHRRKEGTKQKWDKPPADTGHPGEDVQCRCVPIPDFAPLLGFKV